MRKKLKMQTLEAVDPQAEPNNEAPPPIIPPAGDPLLVAIRTLW